MNEFSVIKSIKDGFGLLSRDWKVFLPFALPFMFLFAIQSWFVSFVSLYTYASNSGFAYKAGSDFSTEGALIILIACLINWPIYLALNYQMDHSLSNKRVEWWPALKQGLKKTFPVLGACLIFGLFILLVVLFAASPGIIYNMLYPGLQPELISIYGVLALIFSIIAFIVVLSVYPLFLLFPLAIVLDNKPFYSSLMYCYKLKKGFINTLKLYGYILFCIIMWALPVFGPLLLLEFLLPDDVLLRVIAHLLLSTLSIIVVYATNVCLYRNLQQSKLHKLTNI